MRAIIQSNTYLMFALLGISGCMAPEGEGESRSEPESTGSITGALTPVQTCNQDPRVNSNLVSLQVCAGARVFFDETFNGNGRSCGTCHAAANNFTIDPAFIATLPASDPLFVFEDPGSGLSGLETADLRGPFALIKENVDGFGEFRFVSRSTPHTLSMATSLARDPGDGTSAAFVQRTGWSGDGAPGDGSLRSFMDGAITQHYPTDLGRTPGVSFRLATAAEKDQVLAFQLAIGRTNDLNLANVTLTDAGAAAGRADFINPMRGRCNHCHANAGANFAPTGLNRNFDTGLAAAPTSGAQQPDGSFHFDGGFGGQNAPLPNFAATGEALDSFGDGTFNTPPLIEAADTAPLFHNNGFGNIESGVAFYGTALFASSPAAAELNAFFGGPLDVSGTAVPNIGRFLRVLNASFNLAVAAQRLQASHTLNVAYWGYRDDIQKGLINLAAEEVKDARDVLQSAAGGSLHPSQQSTLQNVLVLLAEAVTATNPAVRRDKAAAARSSVLSVRAAFGTGMNFTLGTGNLMF